LLLPPTKTRVETVEDGLISMVDFQNYLQGNLQETQIKKIKDYVITEPKIGIGRNNYTHAAEQSMLYRVGMRRIKDFNILVECDMKEIDPTIQSSLLRFGAEGKVVAFEDSKARMGLRANSIQLNPADQTFKLYLSTPAIFKTGWKPDLEKKYGIKAELVAAVVGKPLHIGGFDMVKREPKTMYKAVPAGSVYYYKVTEGYELVEEKLQGEAISDLLKEQGFGIAYVGNY
jgi:CRISPR-associated protein Cmr3